MTKEIFDCIVVGAGPAGSFSAYKLAQQGLTVLLLEKEELPRYKPCGGAVSLKVKQLIDFNLQKVIQSQVNKAIFTYCFNKEILVKRKKPYVYMVMRSEFDHLLTKKAGETGVLVKEKTKVKEVLEEQKKITVFSEKGEKYSAKFIIGADGVYSTIAKKTGLKEKFNNKKQWITMTGEIAVSSDVLAKYKNIAKIDIGFVSKGYAWIFPKRDHLSIGLGQIKEEGTGIKKIFYQFLDKCGFAKEAKLIKTQGYFLPIGATINKVVKDRVILVGDAACLVDPLSGEGIYYALKSAKIAAQVITEEIKKDSPCLANYQKYLLHEIEPEFKSALKISHLFYNFTPLIYNVLEKEPGIIELLLSVIYGEINYNSFFKQVKKHFPLIT